MRAVGLQPPPLPAPGAPGGGVLPEDAPPTTAEIKAAALAFANSIPPKLRTACARAFCTQAVTTYWTQMDAPPTSALRPAPEATYKLQHEGLAYAVALGEAATTLSVDDAAYLIGSTYAGMLPDDVRAERGVFYTPPAVVERLLDAAQAAGVDWSTCKVLDPACGGGAFIGPVARRMAEHLGPADHRVVVRNLQRRLRGFEIDDFAAWISLVFLDVILHDVMGFSDPTLSVVTVGDTLSMTEEPEFDLVVGNPPYGRVRLDAAARSKFKRSLYGHSNMYALFLDVALRWARDGGVISFVAPTSFLSGEYYKNLRQLLGDSAPPVHMDFVTERSGVFDDVLQETLLATFCKGAPRTSPQVNFVDVSAKTIIDGVKVFLPFSSEQPWIIPRKRDDAALVAHLIEMPHRLADWGYKVSTGPLVWNRFKDRLRDAESPHTVPLLWAESVSPDGTFAFRAERRNHSPYFMVKKGDDSLLVSQPCVLLQRTTSKEQPRRLVAAELPRSFIDRHGSVVIENHLNMLVPIVAKPAVSTEMLAAFLNSGAADRVFRCISGSVAVSSYELEAMPLPAPDALGDIVEALRHPNARSTIERACAALYGVP